MNSTLQPVPLSAFGSCPPFRSTRTLQPANSAPLLFTSHQPRFTSYFSSSFFSCTYELQISQPFCFDIHPKCRGCRGSLCSFLSPRIAGHWPPITNSFPLRLFLTLLRFFALFCSHARLNPFLFKRFRTLWQKHRGVGWGRCYFRALRASRKGSLFPFNFQLSTVDSACASLARCEERGLAAEIQIGAEDARENEPRGRHFTPVPTGAGGCSVFLRFGREGEVPG